MKITLLNNTQSNILFINENFLSIDNVDNVDNKKNITINKNIKTYIANIFNSQLTLEKEPPIILEFKK